MQPHFLFNTLNSIAAPHPRGPGWRRTDDRPPGVVAACSLDAADAPLQPLARKSRRARAYLEIERVRFGDRSAFPTIDVPAELESVTVPRFSLQTLIENGVVRGWRRRDGGSIAVTARADGDVSR